MCSLCNSAGSLRFTAVRAAIGGGVGVAAVFPMIVICSAVREFPAGDVALHRLILGNSLQHRVHFTVLQRLGIDVDD